MAAAGDMKTPKLESTVMNVSACVRKRHGLASTLDLLSASASQGCANLTDPSILNMMAPLRCEMNRGASIAMSMPDDTQFWV
jgi:hypothetical protein